MAVLPWCHTSITVLIFISLSIFFHIQLLFKKWSSSLGNFGLDGVRWPLIICHLFIVKYNLIDKIASAWKNQESSSAPQ
jgi:hypothetical protein